MPAVTGNPDEIDFWQAYNSSPSPLTGQTATLATDLLTPSQIAGSGARIRAVEFCYGTDTNRSPSPASVMTIDRATVVEFSEPATCATGTFMAPAYTPTNLIDQPLSLSNRAGCQTISTTSPPGITPGGFLKLEVHVRYKLAGYNGTTTAQVVLELGRVSTTYTP